MSYDLVTYCSESYKDSLKFCLPWWLDVSGCDRIIVYTDSDQWKVGEPHHIPVHYRAIFSKRDGWLANIGRQPDAVRHYVSLQHRGDRFVFIGTDCLTIRPLTQWFDNLNETKCIGAVRFASRCGKMPVNHFLGVVSPEMEDFVGRWSSLSNELWRCGVGIVPGQSAYDQISYALLVNFCTEFTKNIVALDELSLLSEHDDLQQWAYNVAYLTNWNLPVFMLHFKGGRWKNKELVNEMLTLAGVKHDQGRVPKTCRQECA